MNEYLKRDEVLDKLDAMIAYWETRDDCWVHTMQVVRSAIASIEPVEEKWVRVDERLPEIIYNSSEDVLIHLKNGEQYVAIYVGEDKDFGIEAYWSTSDMHKDFECSKVTHWQPLPEPPTDGGVKND